MSLPALMLASAGQPPADNDPRWSLEFKWDGARGLVEIVGGSVRIMSRNRNDLTRSFPDLAVALSEQAAGRDMVLDSEIVTPDPTSGAPSFRRLQRRLHTARPTADLLRSIPARLHVFDLLRVDGEDVTELPLRERRAMLDALDLSTPPIVTPPAWQGIPASRMLEVAQQHQLEGIIAKRLDSAYTPGRSRMWLKVVLTRRTEVIICGWTPSRASSNRGMFASLHLAAHNDVGELEWLGSVGTGFSDLERRALQSRLNALATPTCPLVHPPQALPPGVRWVRAEIVGEVRYRERSPAALRHPVWLGLRSDRAPNEVKLPSK
ncbi:ATP-dependent DNA ligase [Nocardia sp. NPDC052566]|uniref:ATP-dependent DNA ligase n=1 Tax=Nocardia sp. NPDC052566 TaxID=3364330 RepID=UPI0037CB665C